MAARVVAVGEQQDVALLRSKHGGDAELRLVRGRREAALRRLKPRVLREERRLPAREIVVEVEQDRVRRERLQPPRPHPAGTRARLRARLRARRRRPAPLAPGGGGLCLLVDPLGPVVVRRAAVALLVDVEAQERRQRLVRPHERALLCVPGRARRRREQRLEPLCQGPGRGGRDTAREVMLRHAPRLGGVRVAAPEGPGGRAGNVPAHAPRKRKNEANDVEVRAVGQWAQNAGRCGFARAPGPEPRVHAVARALPCLWWAGGHPPPPAYTRWLRARAARCRRARHGACELDPGTSHLSSACAAPPPRPRRRSRPFLTAAGRSTDCGRLTPR